MVSEKSLGTGIGKIWYRKKYRYRYRKYLVPEKSLVSVSFNILGTVTHCDVLTQSLKSYLIYKRKSLSLIWSNTVHVSVCWLLVLRNHVQSFQIFPPAGIFHFSIFYLIFCSDTTQLLTCLVVTPYFLSCAITQLFQIFSPATFQQLKYFTFRWWSQSFIWSLLQKLLAS